MPGEGFRAAQAYTEVTARLDQDQLLATAHRAGQELEDALQDHGQRAGAGLTGVLSRHAQEAGEQVARSVEGRLRDNRGRFLAAGSDVGKGVGKGAADETDRNGFRAFLGFVSHAPKAGLQAATGLVQALGKGIHGPAAPYLIAGLSAGAIVAGPLVGATLAGGIMAGIAGAGIGGGIIAQAKDPEVKHAFAELGSDIGDMLTDASSPFKAELLEAADRGRSAFQRWEPMFRQIFATSSTMLDPFLDALEFTGDRLLPSIMTTINRAGPAVNALADGIEGTVDAVGDVVDMLGDNGPEAAVALRAAFFLVESSIRNVGWVVNGLTEGFGVLIEAGLDFLDFLAATGEKLDGLPGPLKGIGSQLKELRPVSQGWRQDWEGLKKSVVGATAAGSSGTSQMSDQTKLLSLSMGAAIQEAGSLSAAFKLLNGGALSAREAESNFQAAIDRATASMKENGKTLDLRTEKGRANDAALRTLISSTDQLAQATYEETAATKGSAAAEAAAAAVYANGRAQLIKSAQAMGMSKAEAIAYADRLMKIPKSWNTKVNLDDQASKKAQNIRKEITKIHGKTVVVTVKYETHGDIKGEHTIGVGTNTFAGGGEVTGGSGWRDDVPVLAMGGEWVIQKAAVAALERQFGPDFMTRLNTWHLGGQSGPARKLPGGELASVRPVPARGGAGGGGGAGPIIYIGTVTLDASRLRDIQDVIQLVMGIATTARTYRAGSVTLAGR